MRRLFQALSQTSDGAFVIDEQHKVIFWNKAAQQILGYSPQEAHGLHCYKILGGRDEQGRTLCQRYCWVAMNMKQSEAVPNIDVYAECADGGRTWINVTTLAVPIEGVGSGNMIVHLFRDANQKKRNEQFVHEFREMARRVRGKPGQLKPPSIRDESASAPLLEKLTPRQSEVLLLLTHGLSTSDIASTLSISSSTVRNHIQNILNKLGVHSRLEAVAYAHQHRLIEVTTDDHQFSETK